MTPLSTGTAASPDNLADDMLNGAVEIAAFIRRTKRQAEHLLEHNHLPAFKIGGRWRMRKSTYLAFIERLEAEAMTSPTKVAA
jgi:hypothetical protein